MFENNPLIAKPAYLAQYDKNLLHRIPRSVKRSELSIDNDALPFFGVDIWNAYELSWLNMKGKPEVRTLELRYLASSEYMVESKSLKLYLNSFHNTNFDSENDILQVISRDLSSVLCTNVSAYIKNLSEPAVFGVFNGICVDDMDVICKAQHISPQCLQTSEEEISETIYSHLLKSNCYITNQPDFGSVMLTYTGKKISHEGFLQYIVSYRNHSEFHEQCVERIFMDIMQYCQPQSMSVYARYTRRGGIDINPFRSTESYVDEVNNMRLIRQ